MDIFRMFLSVGMAGMFTFLTGCSGAAHQDRSRPLAVVEEDGTVHVRSFDLQLSRLSSKEARQAFVELHHSPKAAQPYTTDQLASFRQALDQRWEHLAEHVKVLYPVDVEERRIAGVRTLIITPKGGVSPSNRDRVLIELHMGGFAVGARNGGLLDGIPVASRGKIRVVAVDYRLAPENHYPVATDDVVAVYKELLKDHRPENIGIYGSSIGGLLASEAVARLLQQKAPGPGAIGILCSSADASFEGDSLHTIGPLTGMEDPGSVAPSPGNLPFTFRDYFGGVDLADPQVSPARSLEVLAHFPPTVILTSTRAFELSSAVYSHSRLVQAGVQADLHVWDGLEHCFFPNYPDLPESRDAMEVVARFFDQQLGRERR